MATEAERKKAKAEVAKREKAEWEAWVKLQEERGYTVEGDGFHNCRVVELPPGPTYNVEVS